MPYRTQPNHHRTWWDAEICAVRAEQIQKNKLRATLHSPHPRIKLEYGKGVTIRLGGSSYFGYFRWYETPFGITKVFYDKEHWYTLTTIDIYDLWNDYPHYLMEEDY